eukprot:11087665-Ditylum_brightwellii.AAC.1
MVIFVTSIIDTIQSTQTARKKTLTIHVGQSKRETDTDMEKFYVAMDNYFILPHVIKHLRKNGIGVVGTTRMRKGLPPPGLRNTQARNFDFNEFRYLIDEHGILVAQWMDNGLVLLVSTIHHVGKHVLVNRERPRITARNENHMMKVWGNNFRMDIFIPLLVYHYNKWMGCVDVIDQRISYYILISEATGIGCPCLFKF